MSEWIGIAKDPAYKTVWDWLEILFVPAAISVSIFLLDRVQKERERDAQAAQRKRELAVEEQRAQDEALQAYLGYIGDLIRDKEVRQALYDLKEKNGEPNEVRTLAQARTLTALDRVDGYRKAHLLLFR